MESADLDVAVALEELARLGEAFEDEPNAPHPRRAGGPGYRDEMVAWSGPVLRNRRRAQLRAVVGGVGAAVCPRCKSEAPDVRAVRKGKPCSHRWHDADGCVVATAPLCELLQDFVLGWRRTRPSLKGQYGEHDSAREPIGPYEWLEADTGLTNRQIRRMRNVERYPVTELRVADVLVASIGEPAMFDGALRILPNPQAPPVRRAECCGGSENSLLGC